MAEAKRKKLKFDDSVKKPEGGGFVDELKQMASDFASGFTQDTLTNVKEDKQRNRRRLGR